MRSQSVGLLVNFQKKKTGYSTLIYTKMFYLVTSSRKAETENRTDKIVKMLINSK